jgi:hypothetical protein
MEKNYRFSDYHTLASINKRFPEARVCFAEITNRNKVFDVVYLYIAKDKDFGFPKKLRHNLTLNLNELRKLIKLTKVYYPFKYKITSITHNKIEYYNIRLKFEKFNDRSILFVLTALRYSYEFPFNVICKDTFKLMKDPHFKSRGFFNICNFIFRLFFNNSERTVHSLCDTDVLYTKKSLVIERLKKIDRVHSLFNYGYREKLNEIEEFNLEKYNQEFWDNNFSERYNIYINNIKNFNKK